MTAATLSDKRNRRRNRQSITPADLPRLRFICVSSLVALNACDLLVTRLIIHLGLGHEGNPVMAAIIVSQWAVILKIGWPAFTGWRFLVEGQQPRPWRGRRRVQHARSSSYGPRHMRRWTAKQRRVVLWLMLAVVEYLCVVAWNLHLLRVRS